MLIVIVEITFSEMAGSDLTHLTSCDSYQYNPRAFPLYTLQILKEKKDIAQQLSSDAQLKADCSRLVLLQDKKWWCA